LACSAQASHPKINGNENYASLKRERARKQSAVSRERPGAKQKQKESNRKYRQKNRAQQRYNKAMRRARTYNATPPWLSMEQKKKIRKLYEERQLRSEMEGIEYHVDHIIPLVFYDNVCGLHVPWNLQLLTEHEHKLKTLNEQKLKRKDFITDKMVAIYTG
jgi:hypothetical protein